MTTNNRLFTSESVTEGHPDKVADQISDAVLDAIIAQDKDCRVACETLVTTGIAFIAGEITTSCWVDIPAIVRNTIHDIGYNDSCMGFDWETCGVVTSIDKQSPDIAQGVNESTDKEMGAGDQGLMFGYATNETEELMPLPISLAHKLSMRLARVRKKGVLNFLRPDGKTQVTVQYNGGGDWRVDTVVVATQHTPDVKDSILREAVIEEVIKKVIPKDRMDGDTNVFINATGRFVVGGPHGDCGITGRKIIVDTYGGHGSHGGGCFSGKDPTKMDRSGSYMARHVAKNIVAAELADKCEVQFAYVIGVADPVSIMVDTFGTGKVSEEGLVQLIREFFPLKPKKVIEYLDLLRPIYRKTSCYGHFGRNDPEFSWEDTRRAAELKEAARSVK